MPSRWRTIAAFVSGTLLLTILIFWVRSYFFYDQLINIQARGVVGFNLGDGALLYTRETYSPPIPTGVIGWHFGDYIAPGRRRSNLLSSLWAFHWGYRTGVFQSPAAGAGKPSAVFTVGFFSISLPMWPLLFPAAVLPLWFYLRGRGKVRWSLRDDIAWMNFRLRSKLKRFAIFSAAGIAAGALLGWIDEVWELSRSPMEWSLTLLFLLPVVDFLVILTRRRIPWRRGLLWMALEIAGFVCFFIATLQECWRVLGGWRLADVNLAPGALFLGAISFVIGVIILALLQLKPSPIKPGPYCPTCGYCLIGSPRQICAECGRPFTFEELGITAEELNPISNFEFPPLRPA
jgi:hypothetical protein